MDDPTTSHDGSVDLDQLDLQVLATIVGSRLADRVTERLEQDGWSGLSFGDGYIIQRLIDGEPTVTDLAAVLGVTTQAVSQRLRALERLGYVERAKDEADRRVTRVRLTARGRSAVEAARVARNELEDELATMTSRAVVDRALESLRSIAAALGTADEIASRSVRPPR